jgi:hypothetical protein
MWRSLLPREGRHCRFYEGDEMNEHQDIIDGMPSVTVVISTVFKHWFNFDMVPEGVLEEAKKRGVDVHHSCAVLAQGLFPMIAPEYQGYLDSFRRWFDLMVEDVLLSEERLVDPVLGYHGCPDLLVRSKQGEIILVDLKTPQVLMPTWKWQLAAYDHLVEINKGWKIERCGSLRLNSDGGPAKMEYYEDRDRRRNFMVFLSALNVYKNAI